MDSAIHSIQKMAMGQNPVPPVNIPIPTQIGSKMGGELTYPKMGSQNFFEQPNVPRGETTCSRLGAWRVFEAWDLKEKVVSPRAPVSSGCSLNVGNQREVPVLFPGWAGYSLPLGPMMLIPARLGKTSSHPIVIRLPGEATCGEWAELGRTARGQFPPKDRSTGDKSNLRMVVILG